MTNQELKKSYIMCVIDFLFVSMGVTAEMLRPFLEGWSVKQIIDAKRLFMCDYKILDNLPTVDDRPVSTVQKKKV